MKKVMQLFIVFGLIAGMAGCGTTEETDSPKETDEENSAGMKIADDVEYGEADYEQIAGANNVLGMKLMKDLSETEEGNIFVSPSSLYMALAMVYNGADGVTKDEIAKVLEAEGISRDQMNKANASLITKLSHDSEEIELNIANSIWIKDSYRVLEDFIESSQDYYNAKIDTIDVTEPASADLINNWVSDSTNGKIEEMAAKPLPGNLVAMLLNAVYFKGSWQFPFNEDLTEEQPFFLMDGSTAEVPLMTLRRELSYLETENFQAVSLPYGEGEMNMQIFLPVEGSSLDELKASMDAENWTGWTAEFESKEGTVLLPKFEMEYEVILNDTLKRLGMETAFSSVNLSNMFESSSGLYISEVKQKTYLDVNEQGTEAAAATSISIAESGPAVPPFEMKVNRPFFFAITDEETGVIMFMGSIENPVK